MKLKEKHSKALLELREKIYNLSYYIGVFTLRRIISIYDGIKKTVNSILRWLKNGTLRAARWCVRGLCMLGREIADPFKSVARFIDEFWDKISDAKKEGGWKAAFATFTNLLRTFRRAINRNLLIIASYVAPLAAVLVLTLTVSAKGADGYAVKVSYGDRVLGYVLDESVFFAGQELAQDRIVYASEDDVFYFQPQFEVTPLDSDEEMLDVYEVCDMLIRYTDDFVEATGLYINDELVGVTSNGIALQKQLDDILDAEWSGDENETVDFYDKVELRDGAYPESSLISTDEMKELLGSNTRQEKIYIIEEGDAPILIAQKNGITLSELRALNPEIDTSCFIGQEVLVNASEPLIKIKTMVIETEEVEVPYQTISSSSTDYSYGYKRTLVAGQNGTASQTVQKTYVNGILTDSEVLSSVVIEKPVTERLVVGTYISSTLQASTGTGEYEGQFIWPVRYGGYITCGITGYRGHTGIDIGGVAYGTDILAAAPGVVIKSYKGWTGYGHYIIIDHGNGVQTLYAHCSKLYVSVGETVEQGDRIAALGETGNADGKHLHFEIRMNGKYMNAANFIGTYYGQVVRNKIS